MKWKTTIDSANRLTIFLVFVPVISIITTMGFIAFCLGLITNRMQGIY